MASDGKIELLAPAGGWEQLEYAIRFGADAVYLATNRFGMRARACNFSLAELHEVVAYAHERNVKVHLTANIIMHQSDIDELPQFFETVQAADIDALIISDLGAFALAKKHAPGVELHVSTQASVSNAQSALVWYEMGARRIVCAREMSLESIAQMHQQLPDDLQLEAFVHGAMCMAYSGRCLISDFTTGRSALAGNCAQSCRWNYQLIEEKRPGQYYEIEEDKAGSYLLNAQDLNMVAHVQELADAGIDSIKIEGRNKKAYYVATAVHAYRQALDGAPADTCEQELETISHRPYSTGFYFGPAHQTPENIDYIRGWEWAAQALEPASDGWYKVRCRNKFESGQTMELLSPHTDTRKLNVEAIQFLPEEGEPQPVGCANRTNENYLIKCNCELRPYDIIRVKR